MWSRLQTQSTDDKWPFSRKLRLLAQFPHLKLMEKACLSRFLAEGSWNQNACSNGNLLSKGRSHLNLPSRAQLPSMKKRTTPKILMPVTFFRNSLKPAILGDTKRVGIILELYSVDRSSKLSPIRGAVYARTDGHREWPWAKHIARKWRCQLCIRHDMLDTQFPSGLTPPKIMKWIT